ncbi:MAG: hypothetical protein DSZ10_03675, partial [Sulfurovum sp.]
MTVTYIPEEKSFYSYMSSSPTLLDLRKSFNLNELKYHFENPKNPALIIEKHYNTGIINIEYEVSKEDIFKYNKTELYEYLIFNLSNLEFEIKENVLLIPENTEIVLYFDKS